MSRFSYNKSAKYSAFALVVVVSAYAITACGKKAAQFASGSSKVKLGSSKVIEGDQVAIPPPVGTPELANTPDSQNSVDFQDTAEFTATPEASATIDYSSDNFRTAVAPAGVWVVGLSGSMSKPANVYRINLDKDRGYPVQRWDMRQMNRTGDEPFVSGSRTYVSEIGLIIGRTFENDDANDTAGIWRVSDDNLASAVQVVPASELGMQSGRRICVTSFKDGEKKYIGATYTGTIEKTDVNNSTIYQKDVGTSIRKFVKIPIDETKSNKMDVANTKIYKVGNPGEIWGYSCFMDQNNKRFWSKYGRNGIVYGVNVSTGAAVLAPPNNNLLITKVSYSDPTLDPMQSPLLDKMDPQLLATPKPGVTPTPLPAIISTTQTYSVMNNFCRTDNYDNGKQPSSCLGSYVLSGDPKGNLVNTNKFKSAAYDPLSDMHIASSFDYEKSFNETVGRVTNRYYALYAIKADCFIANVPCPAYDPQNAAANAKFFAYKLPSGLGRLSLSSLNDGRVIGLDTTVSEVTGINADVYLISLKNKQAPGEGMDIVKIATIAGNPYMYTDFTGATLYSQTASNKFELSAKSDFKPGISVKNVQLLWNADGATSVVPWQGLKLKYRCYAKAGNTPDWSVAANVADSGTAFELANCNGAIDVIEVQAEADGISDTFSHTKDLQMKVVQ